MPRTKPRLARGPLALTPDKIRRRIVDRELRVVSFPDPPSELGATRAKAFRVQMEIARAYLNSKKTFEDLAAAARKNGWTTKKEVTRASIYDRTRKAIRWMLDHGCIQTREPSRKAG